MVALASPAGRALPRPHRGEALLRAPWYEAPGSPGLVLHRYLDEEFVERFRQDLEDRPEANAALSAWRAEDVAGPGLLKLRRPIHRAFHIAACEAVCDRPGLPALGPEHIAAAGLVIRRRTRLGEQGWMLANGLPLGWRPLDGEGDPETWRRLPPHRQGRPPSAYTGEEVRPLHPLLVRDSGGRLRCILFGFLSLGGEALPTAPRSDGPLSGPPPEELPWPFGLVNHPSGPPSWSIEAERQVARGLAAPALAALLRVLVFRFQLGLPEGVAPANDGLWAALDGIAFSRPAPGGLSAMQERTHAATHPLLRDGRPLTLAGWLRRLDGATRDTLIGALSNAAPTASVALPGLAEASLLVPEGHASSLRAALSLRGAAALRQLDGALPVPRFGREDTCVARPFLRVRCEDGCERLAWGGESAPFRVALPFDPDATRPVLIQMPSLADLRRGAARGAAFAIPRDVMAKLSGLRSKDGAAGALKGEMPAESPLGLDFICSFSIPVITLCALILLMIVINLFNLIFWWLPWVIICLPLPR
ncbi:hypothetical protein [Paracraurococcus ruber]|uniref:Uncharacterized protein n=1 Tax=Paracraurococcus ruber TaxID=77675 RepID=A0ABS1CRZ3_9PROT|nr:hypothetical protein [Paracraurococcus ruber]MBK1657110.1 hypothetical protein [Paracraurococcus ruber]TDG33408.1 hypothetical protein E2C05_04070 [Paracraurococcus ruber]